MEFFHAGDLAWTWQLEVPGDFLPTGDDILVCFYLGESEAVGQQRAFILENRGVPHLKCKSGFVQQEWAYLGSWWLRSYCGWLQLKVRCSQPLNACVRHIYGGAGHFTSIRSSQLRRDDVIQPQNVQCCVLGSLFFKCHYCTHAFCFWMANLDGTNVLCFEE